MKEFDSKSFATTCGNASVHLISQEIGYGISDDDRQRTEAIWHALATKGVQPRFENMILNVLEYSIRGEEVGILCGVMPYRYAVARRYDRLASVHPLGITGVTERADRREVLVGRRALSVLSHGGCYETSPSGGVELDDVNADGSIDIFGRIAEELFEETKIPKSYIEHQQVFGFYFDAPTATFDILVKLSIANDPPFPSTTQEYEQLNWLNPGKVSGLLTCKDKNIVGVSRWALAKWLDAVR